MSKNSWRNKFGVVKNGVLKEFNVYRADWSNGANKFDAVLLDEEGHRCCIGFMAAACGVPDGDMLERATVSKKAVFKSEPMLSSENQAKCFDKKEWDVDDPFYDAYSINDDHKPRGHIERNIQRWFLDVFDVKVNFIDGHTPKGK